MGYLLDTNIVFDLMRDPRGRAAQRIEAVGPANVRSSILVIAEVRFGLAMRPSASLAKRLEQLVETIEVAGFDAPADAHYGRVRADLERSGTPIGAIDLMIAAHALALGHVLVTDNEREFARIEGLRVENWLR